MIDQELKEVVRSQVAEIPAASGDLDRVIARGRRRRQVRIARLASVMVVVAMGAVVALTAIPSGSRPVTSGGVTRLDLVDGFSVPIVDQPVRSEGALVYQALPGPDPTFDVSVLGTELPIQPKEAAALVVPVSNNPLNALQADRLVYLGDIDKAQLALHVFDGDLCLFIGNYTKVTGGGTCDLSDGFARGKGSVDPPIGNWTVWTKLPDEVAVVTVTTAEGEVFWQRPVGRTVFFDLPGDAQVTRDMLVGLNADGKRVATPGPDPNQAEIAALIVCLHNAGLENLNAQSTQTEVLHAISNASNQQSQDAGACLQTHIDAFEQSLDQ